MLEISSIAVLLQFEERKKNGLKMSTLFRQSIFQCLSRIDGFKRGRGRLLTVTVTTDQFPRTCSSARYGSAVPDFDFTSEISELLIMPFTVTS